MSSASTLPGSDRQRRYGATGRSRWLDIDWRQHQRWVFVMGRPVNVIDLGKGPPLVFVHGLSGSWPNWLEQLPAFADSHRVIAPDLPGFGHSPMPADTITISGYARLIAGLMTELGLDAATLVGNSMGGFISAELAIAAPERVERLVLVSPAGISTHVGADLRRVVASLRRAEQAVRPHAAWTAAHAEALARRPGLRNATLGLVTRHPGRLGAPLVAEQLRGTGKPGFMQALEASLSHPIRERLGEITSPTLIVWGEEDRVIPVRDADVFEQLIPSSRKVIFKDTGHMAMLERPEAFNQLLGGFLGE